MSTEIKKIDRLIDACGWQYWQDEALLEYHDPELLAVAGEIRKLESKLEALHAKLGSLGYGHRFSIQVDYKVPPEPWPDDALTVDEALAFLDGFDGELLMSSGFEGIDSYRGKFECLAVDPTEAPIKVWALKSLLYQAKGRVFYGYKGGEYYMSGSTRVYVSHYGTSDGAVTLSKTYLEKMLTPVAG